MNGKLTKKQIRLATGLVFEEANVSTDAIIAAEGLTAEKYAEWLLDRDFISYLAHLSRNAAEAGGARIIASLSKKCVAGDTSAAKAYFDIILKLKREDSAGDGTSDAEVLHDSDIEAVRREVFGTDASE